ncbi:uncharacterized protein LOC110880801 [Helianthus annuus]|uniref:uncharacterized protein LOC110880801 n=1 Tax=Helianthus annuus TaxID=4232 RepID=UPI000B8FE970|nr:uncharacterized protein LOC110880801 [Helianthus annuus]
MVRTHLKAAQDRQKSYADKRRRPIEFQVGNKVMPKVSPWKGVIRFRKKGKLSPRFIGPFTVIERVGKVAYRLDLAEELSRIHSTFHVSHLRKCLADETTYIHYDDIEVDDRLNYVVKPVAILDRKVKTLRNKEINQVKVKWEHKKGADTTWESEEEMQRLYPTLFDTNELEEEEERSEGEGELGFEKLTRAQRKRLRKNKLNEGASKGNRLLDRS